MVFCKETDCSLHRFTEETLNNTSKNFKNLENGNILYVYHYKGSLIVNPSNVFLCALHHCNHVLGIKVILEQKLCLSS